MTPKLQVLAHAFVCSPVNALRIGVEVWLDRGKDLSAVTLGHHLRLLFDPDRLTADKEQIVIDGHDPWLISRHGTARECRVMSARQLLGLEPRPPMRPNKKLSAEQQWQLYCEGVSVAAGKCFSRVGGV